MMQFGLARFALIVLAGLCAASPAARAQGMAGGSAAPLITRPIDERMLVTLAGNTRPEANTANDRGPVAKTFPVEHMLLQLRRSAEQEQALVQLIDQLHDPASPNFHGWLTPAEYGARFGLAAADLGAITGWLQGQGFQVNTVYPSGVAIDFSGAAGQVSAAFHTAIHYLDVGGVGHFANMSDPQIPAALAPAVVGIVSLHDFRPKPQVVPKSNYTFYNGAINYAATPADLATIYNINPLFTEGISGRGQTIYLVEDTDLYSKKDWTTFRSTFGLSGYTAASLNTIHPAPASGTNCSDPGIDPNHVGADFEAILDAEYASAAAPNAAIVMATCADAATFGELIAIHNLVNSASPPAIISNSYGDCEAGFGAAANANINSIYQQGVAEGVSIFVASGDQLASVCAAGLNTPTPYGIGVNAYASTPYNVAVGGTDFSDTYSGTNSTYWNSSNTGTYASAKSYIPEIPWNDSCASQLIAASFGFSSTFGSSGSCNNLPGSAYDPDFLTSLDVGGSGGPSGCATGNPSILGVVSGTCAGYAKPSWQSGIVGNPSDGVRDLPDVSLFAANGFWWHYYIVCWSDRNFYGALNGGGAAPCTGAPSGWSGAGGTSFASPIMAGVQALVNQLTEAKWGNPNPTYYQFANEEYGSAGSSSCNSSNGSAVGNSCIFYDVTVGDNDGPCEVYDVNGVTLSGGSVNCNWGIPASGTYGVLSNVVGYITYQPAYNAEVGWDFATGIGTINAYNLVTNWCLSTGLSKLLGPQFCHPRTILPPLKLAN
jgi:subtilase family serine protease